MPKNACVTDVEQLISKKLKKELLSKKITIIGINYYPEDSAIGLYTTQKAEHLANNGYDVTVITGFPYYPQWEIPKEYKSKPYLLKETINGVNVFRSRQYVPAKPTFFKRILHLSSFTFGNFFNLFRISKPDLVISIVPFTTSILLGWFLKLSHKSTLWVHIQDFELDAASQTGLGASSTTTFFKILFKAEKILLSRASLISTISNSMMRTLHQKSCSETYFLPNWIDENKINPKTSKRHQLLGTKKIKILYSGNIGEKQDWDIFMAFCRDIDASKNQIIAVGDGAKKDWLTEEISALDHVAYHSPVPYEELSDLLCSADLHILFQKTDVLDTVMPSKILGMMASGIPSLVIGNKDSEIKKILETSNGGLFFSNYSSEVVYDVKKLIESTSRYEKMGKDAREYVLSNFSKEKILNKMTKKVRDLLYHN